MKTYTEDEVKALCDEAKMKGFLIGIDDERSRPKRIKESMVIEVKAGKSKVATRTTIAMERKNERRKMGKEIINELEQLDECDFAMFSLGLIKEIISQVGG